MVEETNRETMSLVLDAFGEAARQNCGSYAYSSGYFQSALLGMFGFLPEHLQQSYIAEFVKATQEQEKQFIHKVLENRVVEFV